LTRLAVWTVFLHALHICDLQMSEEVEQIDEKLSCYKGDLEQ